MDARAERADEKRSHIVDCATLVINAHGVRGASLTQVAAAAGMSANNIAYYFKKKEDLAAACFHRGVERLDALVDNALEEPTCRRRLSGFLESIFALKSAIVRGDQPDIPIFSDIRTLGEPLRAAVSKHYAAYFEKVQALFDGADSLRLNESEARARANILLEQIYWMSAWLPRYELDEYPRVCARVLDMLSDGVARQDARWPPEVLELAGPEDFSHGLSEDLIVAATTLINEKGYKGASIDMITASMNRTKGAFYSHRIGKDDLVLAGFERSFAVVRQAQTDAAALKGDAWARISALTAALAEHQLSPRGPLMRTSALHSLPEHLRSEVIASANRMARRLAGMISDGVSDGTLRPVDPAIAAQMLGAGINSVADRRLLSGRNDDPRAARHYAEAVLFGVLSDRSAAD